MKFPKLQTLLLAFCCFLSATVLAQAKKITGKIISEEDNKPLLGVTISIKGKQGGTQTNTNGEFSIDASQGDVLVFSFTGYTSQEVPVGTSSIISLSMKTDATKLN